MILQDWGLRFYLKVVLFFENSDCSQNSFYLALPSPISQTLIQTELILQLETKEKQIKNINYNYIFLARVALTIKILLVPA